MNQQKRIKIVKREERGRNQKAEANPKQGVERQPNTAQTVAGHVAAWVKDFQRRRVEESRRSFQSLFTAPDASLKSFS